MTSLMRNRSAEGIIPPPEFRENYQIWKLSLGEAMGTVIKDVRDLQVEISRAVCERQEFIARKVVEQRLTDCFRQGVEERGLSIALGFKEGGLSHGGRQNSDWEGDMTSFAHKLKMFKIRQSQHSMKCCFAITRNGYMFLVPPGCKAGDFGVSSSGRRRHRFQDDVQRMRKRRSMSQRALRMEIEMISTFTVL